MNALTQNFRERSARCAADRRPEPPAVSAALLLRISVFCGVLLGCVGAPAFGMGRSAPGEDRLTDQQLQQPAVWERPYEGYVTVPDPSNRAVGYRRTGESCTISLRPGPNRDLWVRSSFWEEEKLALADGQSGWDFYLGRLPDNRAFILQTDAGKKPVAVSITGYDKWDRLIYGPNYSAEDRAEVAGARECAIPLKRPQRRTSQ